jgi:lactoylglutathione lyase
LEAKVLKDYVYPQSRLVFLEVGGTIVELIGKADNEPRGLGPIEHIAFKVDNLGEKLVRLEELGIAYTEPRQVGTAEVVFFEGPNNERFEFVARVVQG